MKIRLYEFLKMQANRVLVFWGLNNSGSLKATWGLFNSVTAVSLN